MQKISVKMLDKLITSGLTSNELNIILYTGRYQDNFGSVQGIYYKDVCEVLDMSYQGFYDALNGLKRKKIITYVKNTNDYDITFLDNQNFSNGYISLKYSFLRNFKFLSLRVGAKLMAMDLLRKYMLFQKNVTYSPKSNSFQILKDNLLSQMSSKLNVSKRMVRSYLSDLKPFISLYLQNGRKYYIRFLDAALQKKTKGTENDEYRENVIKTALRRNRIKNDNTHKLEKLTNLMKVYHNQIKGDSRFDLSKIIDQTLEKLNMAIKNKYRWKREIVIPLIDRQLMEIYVN